MDKIINVLIKSSSDPKKTSLTIKAMLLGFVPFIMQAIGIVCAIGFTCVDVRPTLLEFIFTSLAEIIYHVLMVASLIGVVWGGTRKIHKTLAGTNPVLHE